MVICEFLVMRKMSKSILSGLLVLMSFSPLYAGEKAHHLAIQAFSLHFAKINERQAIHPTLGYEYSPYQSVGWQVGFFKDSFGFRSEYIGVNYPVKRFSLSGVPLRFILAGDMVHKKFVKGGEGETRFIPVPMLEAKLMRNLSVNITGSPQLDYYNGKHTNGVIVVQFKLDLDD